jgi:CheY-like chemotaxis protein
MPTPAKPHLLIVEDDSDLLEVMKYVLEEAGYKVSTAADGAAALAIAAEEKVALILLDISMTGMSGIEVARRLRARSETADILVAVHTGLGEASVRAQLPHYDLFVKKSDDSEALLAGIAAVLAKVTS